MFWTPFHLQEFESAVKKLEQNTNRIHLTTVRTLLQKANYNGMYKHDFFP